MWTPLANAAQSADDRPPPIERRPGLAPDRRGDPPCDRRRRLAQRTGRAGEGVEQSPTGLGDHDLGEVLEARRQGERRQAVGQGLGHRSSSRTKEEPARRTAHAPGVILGGLVAPHQGVAGLADRAGDPACGHRRSRSGQTEFRIRDPEPVRVGLEGRRALHRGRTA